MSEAPVLQNSSFSNHVVNGDSSNNASPAKSRELLCLNILGYRKPGMSIEDYRKYLTENHAPLVRDLMVKYGFVGYNIVSHHLMSLTSATRRRAIPLVALHISQQSLPRNCSRALLQHVDTITRPSSPTSLAQKWRSSTILSSPISRISTPSFRSPFRRSTASCA